MLQVSWDCAYMTVIGDVHATLFARTCAEVQAAYRLVKYYCKLDDSHGSVVLISPTIDTMQNTQPVQPTLPATSASLLRRH